MTDGDFVPPCKIVVGFFRKGLPTIYSEVLLTDAVHPGEPGKADPLLVDAMGALTRILAERLLEEPR